MATNSHKGLSFLTALKCNFIHWDLIYEKCFFCPFLKLWCQLCAFQGSGICEDQGSRLQPPALAGGVSAHADGPLGGRSGQVLLQRVPQPAALHRTSHGANAVSIRQLAAGAWLRLTLQDWTSNESVSFFFHKANTWMTNRGLAFQVAASSEKTQPCSRFLWCRAERHRLF